jgi:hypothetical protein
MSVHSNKDMIADERTVTPIEEDPIVGLIKGTPDLATNAENIFQPGFGCAHPSSLTVGGLHSVSGPGIPGGGASVSLSHRGQEFIQRFEGEQAGEVL